MGKSRLIAEGEKMAHRLGFLVGIAAAEPSESVAELAPLLRALFDGPQPLLDRAGLSTLHAAPEQRYWRLQDLQSLLERAAMDNPLLIFLDDAQWADSGTAAALRALPPRLASLPIGWVVAIRPDHGAGQLRSTVEYLADEGAEWLMLEPLSEAAVTQVARDVMQAEPDQALVRIAGEAGGNPFLLVELLEGLRHEELVSVEAGRARLTDYRLPDRVRTSMRQRLDRMSEAARQLATVAGSLGRTFSVSELSEMLGRAPASLLTSFEELNSGPPESPAWMSALVSISPVSCSELPDDSSEAVMAWLSAVIWPEATAGVPPTPPALPSATTSSPTAAEEESPVVATVSPDAPVSWSTAMSCDSS